MNRDQEGIRAGATRIGGMLRSSLSWQAPGGRLRVIVAASVAAVLAVGAGIGWGLAGTGEQPLDPVAAPGNSPDGLFDDGLFDDGPRGSASPGTPVGGSPAGGGGPDPGTGFGSGPGPGNSGEATGDPGSSGDGAGNRPPVIEDLGLSSEGLTIRVAPVVSDPDGDEVTLQVEIDGEPVTTSTDGTAEVSFARAEVGYVYTTTVSVVATDSGGATVSETGSRLLHAVTTVTVRDIRFTVKDPASCFQQVAARRLTGAFLFTGAVRGTSGIDVELRMDRPSVQLLASDSVDVTGKEPVQTVALAGGQFAGISDIANTTHRPNNVAPGSTIVREMFAASGACASWLTYKIDFRTR